MKDNSWWVMVAVIGLFSFVYQIGGWTKNPLWIVMGEACALALAYGLYGQFLASRVAGVEDNADEGESTRSGPEASGGTERPTSSATSADWMAFGYHFAAVAGISALVGPVVSAQFGYVPGVAWILVGAVLAGGAHDFVLLLASVRGRGASLLDLVKGNVGPVGRTAATGLVLLALAIGLTALGSATAGTITGSPWAAYGFVLSLVVALAMALYARWLRRGHHGEAAFLGVVVLAAGVLWGNDFANNPIFRWESREVAVGLVAVYLAVASVVPFWLLSRPRAVAFGYVGLLGIGALATALVVSAPPLQFPATTALTSGPLVPGGLFPYLALVVGGGAISGYYALAATGTTSGLVKHLGGSLAVGYGGMMAVAFVAVLLLVVVSTLGPGDFFSITTSMPADEVQRSTDFQPKQLAQLADRVKQPLAGSLDPMAAVGAASARIAATFPGVPAQQVANVYQYTYKLVFVFYALFLLAGMEVLARVAARTLGDVLPFRNGVQSDTQAAKPLGSRTAQALAAPVAVAVVWSLLVLMSEGIAFGPLLNLAAVLLAVLGLGVGTTIILGRVSGWRRLYALTTAVPMLALLVVGLVGGVATIKDDYWKATEPKTAIVKAYDFLPAVAASAGLPKDKAAVIIKTISPAQIDTLYAAKQLSAVAAEFKARGGLTDDQAKALGRQLDRKAISISFWAYVQSALALLMMLLVLATVVETARRWPGLLARPVAEATPVEVSSVGALEIETFTQPVEPIQDSEVSP